MKYVMTSLVLLAACAPEPDPTPTTIGTIAFQVTGDDGAAAGQVGRVTLTPSGLLTCSIEMTWFPPIITADGKEILRSPDRSPDITVYVDRLQVPGLYSTLAQFVGNVTTPGIVPTDRDFISIKEVNGHAVLVSEYPEFGLIDENAKTAISIVNLATDGVCLPYG